MNLIEKFVNKFFSGEIRSIRAKKNILASILIKGFSLIITFLLVPLTLHYLTAYEYGVWLTISSILTWISFFDIGLGNGLRNKLGEALSFGNNRLAQIYVSTTFFLMFSIMFSLFLIFLCVNPFIDWPKILNVDPESIQNINYIILIAFAFFCLTIIVKTTGFVFIADQKPAFNDFFNLLSNFLALLIIFILTHITDGSLFNVAIVFSASPAVIFLIIYPFAFYSRYKFLRPTLKSVKIIYTKGLLGIGIQFFIIQIAGLIIFTTTNIIISQLFGPQEVTSYNIAYKYFSIAIMVFNIILTPIWSATTDAYAKNDKSWISSSMNVILKVWVGTSIFTIIMIFGANIFYSLWVGPEVRIPICLSILMGFYSIILNWNFCFATFINGMGKIRLQLLNALITGILFIPTALILCKWLGIIGIILAMCLSQGFNLIIAPIQFHKLMSDKAQGIWTR
jgi:O-antigen/teichoic acid export membrane protein